MQDLLLRFLSSIELLASASQGFAINRQMHVPLTWLRNSPARFLSAPADLASLRSNQAARTAFTC
jgi:hypothetical protein